MKDEKIAKEAHAYTPGLKVKRATTVRKDRILPTKGEVLVKVGDKLDFDTVVARASVPGDPYIILVADILKCGPEDMIHYMKKKQGDSVKKDEVFARYSFLFGLLKKEIVSPVDGYLESVSNATGRVIIRSDPIPIDIKSYIPGEVIEVLPEEGAVVETNCAFVQGIFGVGGETHGEIAIAVNDPKERLTADLITPDHKGKIIIGGSLVTIEAFKKAVEVGAKAIIVGGIMDMDLMELLGYEVGVAITGLEELGLTLVLTEGFGEMVMSYRNFNLFKEFEGVEAAVNGETQIRAGVLRPEVVIPHNRFKASSESDELVGGMRPGTPVRVIREPYFGRLGKVFSLPVELEKVESESRVRVMEVELESGEKVIVPRANVEIIEE